MPSLCLLQSDARSIPLASGSVHCVVTSPPYWGLRDYGTAQWRGGDPDCDHRLPLINSTRGGPKSTLLGGQDLTPHESQYGNTCGKCGAERQDNQLGLESVPDCLGWATGAPCGSCYVCQMVQVFREVRRVLRADGTLWLNLGDSYAANRGYQVDGTKQTNGSQPSIGARVPSGLKPKDLVGIPWRVALALQADGWWLRSDIIWHKKAPMPESVTDRPTKAHEYIFLLTKSARYFYDAEAVKEGFADDRMGNSGGGKRNYAPGDRRDSTSVAFLNWNTDKSASGRNSRSVWTLGPSPYPGAHFATFPPELPRRCIMAGTSEHGVCPACGAPWEREIERGLTAHDGETQSAYQAGSTANRLALLRQAARERGGEYGNGKLTTGWRPTCACNAGDPIPATVLDPFAGSGTTLLAARALGRHGIGLDLSADYLAQARQRLDLDRLAAWHNGKPAADMTMDFDTLPLFG